MILLKEIPKTDFGAGEVVLKLVLLGLEDINDG